jgi:hypothetical protein
MLVLKLRRKGMGMHEMRVLDDILSNPSPVVYSGAFRLALINKALEKSAQKTWGQRKGITNQSDAM